MNFLPQTTIQPVSRCTDWETAREGGSREWSSGEQRKRWKSAVWLCTVLSFSFFYLLSLHWPWYPHPRPHGHCPTTGIPSHHRRRFCCSCKATARWHVSMTRHFACLWRHTRQHWPVCERATGWRVRARRWGSGVGQRGVDRMRANSWKVSYLLFVTENMYVYTSIFASILTNKICFSEFCFSLL